MKAEHAPEVMKEEPTPEKLPYATPELVRYGTVEELTLGLGGFGGVDAQSV